MSPKVKVLLATLIFIATVLAYLPAMRGGFIWDDPQHIENNPTLRSLDGLLQIWTDVHSLPQWYPLVHTTFWVEYHLWGLGPLGFHLVNVLLHATSALLLWHLLARLQVPGAALAAAVWALHPVNVESVAWITERKNVLSGLFYLLAMIAYFRAVGAAAALRWAPAWGWYVGAFALFAAALLSKTVTCTLPAAITLVIWWKTGRLRWQDLLPTIPFFVIGALLAWNTAHLEQVRVGAFGSEWQYADSPLGDFLARCIIAGKALWFYAWKLVWPVNLAFIHERWTIDWRDPVQYAYPISFLLMVIVLLLLRNRIGRGPVTAVLFFAGTLFPALGFFNVFPHRYSFVADHFQYLASIGLIALAAALLTDGTQRIVAYLMRPPLAAALVTALAVLTFRQCFMYESAEKLWIVTTQRSPNNWMAWTNLGNALAAQKRYDEAIPHYEKALELAPHVDDVQWNAGVARARQGKFHEAEEHFLRTVQIKRTYLPAWESLGDLYVDELNEPNKAVVAYTRALEIAPHRAHTREKLLRVLLQIDPNNQQARDLLQQMEP